MPEAEVPEEAKNPFERRVAITIAIIAVVLALNENHNDNAKTDAILRSIDASEKTTEAANQWAYFQAKSIKGHSYDIQKEVLSAQWADGGATAETRAKRDVVLDGFAKKVEKYDHEKAEITVKAKALEAEATQMRADAKQLIDINQRCDTAALLLQIAVILCSVAILVHLAPFWYLGMAAALIGGVISASSYAMDDGTSAAHPPTVANHRTPAAPATPHP